MKRLFLVVFAAGAAAGAEPFSHKLHLAQGIECTFCHEATLKSTRADEKLIPAGKVCAECHDDGRAPSRTPPGATPVPLAGFNHALHLRMGSILAPVIASAIDKRVYLQPREAEAVWIRNHLNTGNPCQACHRGLEESDRVTPAALPQMADCLVCHTVIDPPFSCEDCHAKDAPLKPASHTEHFVSDHSSGKLHLDKSTCALCHGRTFTCGGCH